MCCRDYCRRIGRRRRPGRDAAPGPRQYFAAAGRLVTEKGFQTLIPLMRHQPDMELRIAGSGPAEGRLRRLARGLPNVRFEGLLDHDRIRSLFRSARAVIVPSLFPETFGMVAAEAMSLGTPVLARNRGSLPELMEATSGGLTFDDESEMAGHMRRIASDDRLYPVSAARRPPVCRRCGSKMPTWTPISRSWPRRAPAVAKRSGDVQRAQS